MSSVLTRLQSAAKTERQQLDAIQTKLIANRDARLQLWRSLRPFVSDLERSVPMLGNHRLVIRGERGLQPLDWDTNTEVPEVYLLLGASKYVTAKVITKITGTITGVAGPWWQITVYKLGDWHNQLPTTKDCFSTELVQNDIIRKIAKDFPDQFT